jgi:hypothetical protein
MIGVSNGQLILPASPQRTRAAGAEVLSHQKRKRPSDFLERLKWC